MTLFCEHHGTDAIDITSSRHILCLKWYPKFSGRYSILMTSKFVKSINYMFRIFVLLAWKIYLLTNCVKSTDKIVALHPQKEHNPSFFH